MKMVNRGFMVCRPKQSFWNWANQQPETVMPFDEGDGVEPSIYLIEEDFMEEEPVLEQHFKKVFKNELSTVNSDESAWPEKLTLELFHEWFEVVMGSTVFDTQKSDLLSEKF